MIKPLTASTFYPSIQAAQAPVAVLFYSPGCSACTTAKPGFTALALRYRRHAYFGAVNVDAETHLAEHEGIRAVPTLKVYAAGGQLIHVEQGVDAGTMEKIDRVLRGSLTGGQR